MFFGIEKVGESHEVGHELDEYNDESRQPIIESTGRVS